MLSLNAIPMAIIVLLVLALLLGVGATILSTVGTNQCSSGVLTTGGQCVACTATGWTQWNVSSQTCMNSTGTNNATAPYIGGSIAFNSTYQGMTSMSIFSNWVPTIFVVLAASVVIGLIMAYLVWKRQD